MTEEKPQTWRNWSLKVLLWVLIPIGALIAKDVYDYAKSVMRSPKPKPAEQSEPAVARPFHVPREIGSGVLLERFKRLAPQMSEKATIKDAAVKAPIPLILAARGGQLGLVRLLLERGADVNARDKETETTALIVAAQQGHLQVVDILLQKGADPNAKDKAGKTALGEASRYNRGDVVKLLRNRGAK